jgi:thiol-disulfide isomerase/thioredoxin
MFKYLTRFLVFSIAIFFTHEVNGSALNTDTLTIKLQPVGGIGPEGTSFMITHPLDQKPDGEETTRYPMLKNLPANLTGVKQYYYIFDRFQFYYQYQASGAFSKAFFDEKAKYYGWNLADTLALSRKPINSGFGYITGTDEKGEQIVMIDADGDHDLSNDKQNQLRPVLHDEAGLVNSSVAVTTEWFRDGTVIRRVVPVAIGTHGARGAEEPALLFSEYIWGKVFSKGKGYILSIGRLFTSPVLYVQKDQPNFMQPDPTKLITQGNFFKLGDENIRFVSVDPAKNEIKVVPESSSAISVIPLQQSITPQDIKNNEASKAVPVSASYGFMAPEVSGKNINTGISHGQKLSLSSLRGKYVLIDFWGPYCVPCIEEMPNLARLYQTYGKDKLQIIGVFDEPNQITAVKLLRKYHITWPTITMRAGTTDFKGYGQITSFPKSFLVSPDGLIVGIDLRGRALEQKLNELIGK